MRKRTLFNTTKVGNVTFHDKIFCSSKTVLNQDELERGDHCCPRNGLIQKMGVRCALLSRLVVERGTEPWAMKSRTH